MMIDKIRLIAETAWHHEGNFDLFRKLNSSLIVAKGDIIKYHITLDIDEYMDSHHTLYSTLQQWLISKNQ